MKKAPGARELEAEAAAAPPPHSAPVAVSGEALLMLARRGFRPKATGLDVPFPPGLGDDVAEVVAQRLAHYAFRLFLRGAIQRAEGFAPSETTRYLKPSQSKSHAELLVDLGLAERVARARYRLSRPAKSFGGTLEWYVARELRRRYGFDVAAAVKLHARGVGGDLDIVAAAEGKLVYLELKSSPPKNLAANEVTAFFDRVLLIRPDVTLFVVDTALRLADKVVPMLTAELVRRGANSPAGPVRVVRELWAITPHLYAVNGRPDLISNIARAIARGLLALSPSL